MAKRIPIVIDAEPVWVEASTSLSELVPSSASTVTTHGGRIIPRELFRSTRAEQVAEGFETQTATVKMGGAALAADQRRELLYGECERLQDWLDGFEPCAGGARTVHMDHDGQAILVANFPLPDQFRPDYISLGVYVEHYPARPPVGLYLLDRPAQAGAIQRISTALNVFDGSAYHGAEPPMPGYKWICLYTENWRVDLRRPNRGQTIHKFLAYFYALLASRA